MKIQIIISALAVFIMSAIDAKAQGTETIVSQLAGSDGKYSSRIIVEEHGRVPQLLAKNAAQRNKITYVDIYRLNIYNDNSQNARENAGSVLSRFRAEFPDIPAQIISDMPYHRVIVGNYLTVDEALILYDRVRKLFDNPLIKRDVMPLREFIGSAGIITTAD